MITELVMNKVLTERPVEEIAALLSGLVFQVKSNEDTVPKYSESIVEVSIFSIRTVILTCLPLYVLLIALVGQRAKEKASRTRYELCQTTAKRNFALCSYQNQPFLA